MKKHIIYIEDGEEIIKTEEYGEEMYEENGPGEDVTPEWVEDAGYGEAEMGDIEEIVARMNSSN